MAKLMYKREITVNMYEMAAERVAKELGLKYGRFSSEEVNLPLIAVVVADYAENLRNELFEDDGSEEVKKDER